MWPGPSPRRPFCRFRPFCPLTQSGRRAARFVVLEFQSAWIGNRIAITVVNTIRQKRITVMPLRPLVSFVVLVAILFTAWGSPAAAQLPEAEEDSPATLEQDLLSDDVDRMASALDRLSESAKPDTSLVPSVRKLLSHEEAHIRAAAAWALANLGDRDETTITKLISMFDDEALNWSDAPVWIYAASAVDRLKPDCADRLIPLLESDKLVVVRAATIALHGQGERALPALDRLTELAQHPVAEVRHGSLYALTALGKKASPAVPALVKLLRNEDFHTQYWSCRVLGQIGLPAARPAQPVLEELVSDGATSVRGNAAIALGQFGPDAGESAVGPLVKALDDPAYSVRQRAAVALGRLGPVARQATPRLEQALADPNYRPRTDVALSLWQITGKTDQSLPVLLKELQSKDAPWEAAAAIGKMGRAAAPAVPKLTELLDAADAEIQLHAAMSLGGIGRPAGSAVGELSRLRQRTPDKEFQEILDAVLKAIARDQETARPATPEDSP